MSDRTDNRTLARWLLARYKRKRVQQKAQDEINFAAQEMAAITRASLDELAKPMNPPTVSYAAEDRFDFLHCSPADEIRAHGLGVSLSL
jgi:hypothetical protein